MAAAPIIEAIAVLAPLIEKIAGYIAGEHDQLPEVPLVLKSEIELKRFNARAAAAAAKRKPPPLPPKR